MSRRSSYLITSILFATFSLLSSTSMDVSYAQETSASDLGPIEKQQIEAASRAAPIASDVAVQPSTSVSPSLDYLPPPNQQSRIPIVQPFESLRQTADSPVYKKQLRQFISMEVPVMFQTMMMVENGAATGFNWSLSALNALNSNWVQGAQFRLDLMQAANSPNADMRGYVDGLYSVQQRLKKEGKVDLPAALLESQGEDLNSASMPSSHSPSSKDPHGAGAVDSYPPDSSGSETPGSAPEDFKPDERQGQKLLNKLFENTSSSSNDAKKEVENWVGNLQWKSAAGGGGAVRHLQPAKKLGSEKYIYPVRHREFKKEVWIALNSAVKSYCTFKQENTRNNNTQIFDKVRPSDSINEEDWKKIQSLDVKFTINVLDQYFNILLYRQPIDEIDCGIFEANDLPDESQIKSESEGGKRFDNCQNGNEGPLCLPKRILLRFAEFIAESKTNYFYRDVWIETAKLAVVPSHLADLNYLFCINLKLPIDGQFDQGLVCDPEDAFQTRIEQNRQDWISFINDFSQLAQGRSGSSPFRPLSSSIQGSN